MGDAVGEVECFGGARALHVIAVEPWRLPAGLGVGLWYWLGVTAVSGLLLYEHLLVRPGDLRRLDQAFFTVNGVISVVSRLRGPGYALN